MKEYRTKSMNSVLWIVQDILKIGFFKRAVTNRRGLGKNAMPFRLNWPFTSLLFYGAVVHNISILESFFFQNVELDNRDKELQKNALVKLEKAVQPCLNQVTWKQLIMVKRVVTSCYFAMEEVVQELKAPPSQPLWYRIIWILFHYHYSLRNSIMKNYYNLNRAAASAESLRFKWNNIRSSIFSTAANVSTSVWCFNMLYTFSPTISNSWFEIQNLVLNPFFSSIQINLPIGLYRKRASNCNVRKILSLPLCSEAWYPNYWTK